MYLSPLLRSHIDNRPESVITKEGIEKRVTKLEALAVSLTQAVDVRLSKAEEKIVVLEDKTKGVGSDPKTSGTVPA